MERGKVSIAAGVCYYVDDSAEYRLAETPERRGMMYKSALTACGKTPYGCGRDGSSREYA